MTLRPWLQVTGPELALCCGEFDSPPGAATCPPPPPPPPLPPPPLPPPPAVADLGAVHEEEEEEEERRSEERRDLSVPACEDGWARVGDFFVADGSGPADEDTVLWLCWTAEHLEVVGEAADREIVSTAHDCGSETWLGDSLEVFASPGAATPTSWMEMNVAAAGGLWFSAVTGAGAGRRPDVGRQSFPYASQTAEPVGTPRLGQCTSIPGLAYAVERREEEDGGCRARSHCRFA
jgi:hypothetical protein